MFYTLSHLSARVWHKLSCTGRKQTCRWCSGVYLRRRKSLYEVSNRKGRGNANQHASLGASMLVTGHIVKIPVYRILNGDGSIRGYKASVAFQLKVVDVSTGISNEAQGFQGKASKEMLSPESAVTAAMQSIKDDIYEYFRINFPLTAKIVKVLDKKTLVINAGKETGVKVGDKFMVQIIELLDGKPYPSDIGTITVKKQSGASFSECDATSKIISAINSAQQGAVIQCSLIIKK